MAEKLSCRLKENTGYNKENNQLCLDLINFKEIIIFAEQKQRNMH